MFEKVHNNTCRTNVPIILLHVLHMYEYVTQLTQSAIKQTMKGLLTSMKSKKFVNMKTA